MRVLPADISQTHFEDQVETLRRELDEAFDEKADTKSRMELFASVISSVMKGEGGLPEAPKMPMP